MIKLNQNGLIPAIVQDNKTGDVLMMGWMSRESIERTLGSTDLWFYSRSRNELWKKGETSGNSVKVISMVPDCDSDVLLIKAEASGPVCHTGQESCFHSESIAKVPQMEKEDIGPGILQELYSVIQDRKDSKIANSYTVDLLDQGVERIGQKVVEEAGETAIAAAVGKSDRLPEEVADLVYHTLVLIAASGIDLNSVWQTLASRRG
ncbi:MAG: bifunctional phosphoribosyl-AMP cyclohydrolase/phosphoribosyl-ATP diphosphatase HisIE [SAR202 cluster bacterium]|nr:bifunctional phosphoribosyl-AMP cyclohydrolase/phosphoribosyl-ATP diphosphatase HisIE [SAR202 cluster bacterium]|tara:strand:+ start:5607 stop:6224 length:618 start_codon:yes stop_codon:yes gene_type:complete